MRNLWKALSASLVVLAIFAVLMAEYIIIDATFGEIIRESARLNNLDEI